MGDASDRAHQGLRASLERGEVEVSFGRAETREGDWILVSNSHLRWGTPSAPERLGSLPLSKITFSQQMTRYHRWGVALQHEEIDQVVHVPAHRLLLWWWGNDWATRSFEETTLWFSRRETAAAIALRAALTAREVPSAPPIRLRTPARDDGATFVPLGPVRYPRMRAMRRRLDDLQNHLYHGSLAWRVRLPGWLLFSVPLAFINPWLVPLGLLAFEALAIALLQWVWYRDVVRERPKPSPTR